MHWVYLSPHFDDAVYSCGAAIWQQTRAGDVVEIWTICAGEPPADRPLTPFASLLHSRWGMAGQSVTARKVEDAAACALVGATARRFNLLDCIYRYNPLTGEPMVQDEQGLWSFGPHPEPWLVEELAHSLALELHPEVQVAVPLAIGDHTDHRLVRFAAQALGRPLWYYPDAPYAMRTPDASLFYASATRVKPQTLTAPALAVWQVAAATYASQLNTFWPDRSALDAAYERYALQGGGRLIRLPAEESYDYGT
jgi:LmbE family N-acetylglucosaminyl deacetylase